MNRSRHWYLACAFSCEQSELLDQSLFAMIEDKSYLRITFPSTDCIYCLSAKVGFCRLLQTSPTTKLAWCLWRMHAPQALLKTQLLISSKQFEHNACNASGRFQHQLLSVFHNLWGGRERDQSRGNVSWKLTQHNLSTRTNVINYIYLYLCHMILMILYTLYRTALLHHHHIMQICHYVLYIALYHSYDTVWSKLTL